jgi:hypothetical protein
LIASSELLLIAVGSGLLALCGPKFYLPAIVCVVLLARFRGRVKALIAATAFNLVGLGAIATRHRFPQEFTRNGQFAAAISAMWYCALFALSAKSDRASSRRPNSPFKIRLDELTRYVWSRHADGSVEYAMNRVEQTGESQQFRARYLSTTGEHHWFATLLLVQKDSRNNVIRYFGLPAAIEGSNSRPPDAVGSALPKEFWASYGKRFLTGKSRTSTTIARNILD